MIRLQRVKLINFKNVRAGEIDFLSYKNEDYFSKESDLLGFYGQNGSGKTAFIEALWILKNILLGESLPKDCKDYIYQGKKESTIKAILSLEMEENKYLIFYGLTIGINEKRKSNSLF